MIPSIENLPSNKKVYFASDFHLGAGSREQQLTTERKVVSWLDAIKQDASAIYLLGDMFDFWFEYKQAIPKGFIRFQGKLAEISDAGIPITFFTGNHDMWLFDYFPKELNIPVIREPQSFRINDKHFFIGHGDGLGPGDFVYKILKRIFNNKLCQWAFARLHPNLGIGIANYWSGKSRISNQRKEDVNLGENEWLLTFSREQEKIKHHDYYIFGHRHLPLDMEVSKNSRYINLGEWINYNTYAVFDGVNLALESFVENSD
ncbi:UDP-2,3-diacylglucosamine diphosphatase [Fulvivirgaceae bacterium BMA12]|uniref:UDP-2,3-diacylglucosamine diphosphatase n=1 Tax=Agaribacillus aureus TaxID=3051825 RepID=A0ABT8L3T4_9BACT|nr:UDP-2,3-diacylglucosamine diphosphatase [Fulvivirgaceae bacterium BMA12]